MGALYGVFGLFICCNGVIIPSLEARCFWLRYSTLESTLCRTALLGYRYDETDETEREWGAQTGFPDLFINVLFSLRESDRQTGSYTLLLDDFLCWVNTFQLRYNISECKLFWVKHLLRHGRLLELKEAAVSATFWATDTTFTSLMMYNLLFLLRLWNVLHIKSPTTAASVLLSALCY